VIALVDCNSFYAACEMLFRPDLREKPVVVLSNNDACVVAANGEAKKLGIKRAHPLFEMESLIKNHNIHRFSSNYTLYSDLSRRVMDTIGSFGGPVEVYSIDEAFLHLPANKETALLAKALKSRVLQWTGIPVTVGVAPTKTLAKVASREGKTGGGIRLLTTKEDITRSLKKLPVVNVWGIGPGYGEFLYREGILTADQFRRSPDWWIKKHMTTVALRTAWELRGIPAKTPETDPDKKGITSSRQFGREVTHLEDLREALAEYTTLAVEKLTQQGGAIRGITVFLETNPHRRHPQYSNSRTIQLSFATGYLMDILDAARDALEKIYRPGFLYHRVGIILTQIEPWARKQGDLFTPREEGKEILMKKASQVNEKFGRYTLASASRGQRQSWQMRREFLSPRYTTRLEELPRVSAG